MAGKAVSWIEQLTLNLLRVVAGLLLWQHGAQKLFGYPGGGQIGEFFSLSGLAGVLEVVGGVLLVLGLLTRPVALILSVEMAWEYFMVHAPKGAWPIMNQGELAALYTFLFLYLAARGGGAFSVDGALGLGRRGKAPPTAEAPRKVKEPVRELSEADLAEDPEIAELLGEKQRRK